MDRRSFLGMQAGAVGPVIDAPDNPGRSATETYTLHQRALMEREGSLKGLPEPSILPRLNTAGLEAYTPGAQKPWSRQRAGYLLRRTMFGASKADIDYAVAKSPGDIVDELLQNTTPPPAPGGWVNEDYYYDNSNSDRDNRDRFNELRYWWTGLMLRQEFSIREKLTLFWHDHWATESSSVRQPHFNYWMNDLMRRNVLGNFKQMVKDITVSPAMLIYLDGWYNTKNRPNENYARELMELHTLGEGNGYTETDIQNAARALTGWTIRELGTSPVGTKLYHPKDAEFITGRFDATDKTIMGQTGNWDSFDVVDIIFEQRTSQVAHFICRKLYREFVYEIADESIVDQLATLLISSNWELAPVMRTLLKSEHFFESANIGAHITSPQEYYIGSMRTLDIETDNLPYLYVVCASMGLQLFEAPNVKGWPGYRTWISASRLASRWSVADELILANMRTNPKFGVDAIAYASGMSEPNNARKLIQDIIDYAIVLKLSENQMDILLDKLLAGAPEYEWNINLPGSEGHLKDLLKAVLRLSESQLC